MTTSASWHRGKARPLQWPNLATSPKKEFYGCDVNMIASLLQAIPANPGRSSAGPSGLLHDSDALSSDSDDLGSLRTLMFHVHKTGGTTLCLLARKNGETTSEWNCNVGDESTSFGWACDREKAAALSGDAQGSFLRSVPYTFGADECLAPLEPAAGVLTLTSLREPLERAASHFYYDLASGWNAKECTSFDCFVLKEMESDEYHKYYWHNYLTRFFSGTAHTDDIGEAELERAKARLAGVDILVDLADFEASMETLQQRLHWNSTTLRPDRGKINGGGARTVELSPKAHLKLTEANQLDIALYEYYTEAVRQQHALASTGDSQHPAIDRVAHAAVAPEIEHAFYGDSVRIVETSSPTGGVYV